MTTNTKPLDDARAFLDNINREVADIGKGVYQEVAPELTDALNDKPPRPHRKIEWTTEKQRKAYFATDGFGGGIPSTRTDAIINAWKVRFETTAGTFKLIVENANPAARFLFGTLAKSIQAAKKPQQRFHAITGWPLASPLVRDWADVADSLFHEQWVKRLQKITGITSKRRAYTSPYRRLKR